jgi:hypothetical protein
MGNVSRAVAEVELFSGPDAAHVGRVETLVAVNDREAARCW